MGAVASFFVCKENMYYEIYESAGRPPEPEVYLYGIDEVLAASRAVEDFSRWSTAQLIAEHAQYLSLAVGGGRPSEIQQAYESMIAEVGTRPHNTLATLLKRQVDQLCNETDAERHRAAVQYTGDEADALLAALEWYVDPRCPEFDIAKAADVSAMLAQIQAQRRPKEVAPESQAVVRVAPTHQRVLSGMVDALRFGVIGRLFVP